MAVSLLPEMLNRHLSELFRLLNDPQLAGQEPEPFLEEAPDLTSLTRESLVARNLQHEAASVRTRAIRNNGETITNPLVKADIRYVRHQLSILGIAPKSVDIELKESPPAADIRREFEGYVAAIGVHIEALSEEIAQHAGVKPSAASLMQTFRRNVMIVAGADYGYGALFNEHADLDGRSDRKPEETASMAVMRTLMQGLQQMCRHPDYVTERVLG